MRVLYLSMFLLFALMSLNAESPTRESVIRLYVATFNRAPDTAGIDYWLYDSGLNLEQIAESFFDQPETKSIYGNVENKDYFIRQVYLNLFDREPDSAGLEYWRSELENGNIKPSQFILAAINGALAPTGGEKDRDILSNKTGIGYYFCEHDLNNVELAKKVMRYASWKGESICEAVDIMEESKEDETLTYKKGYLSTLGADSQLYFKDMIQKSDGGYIFVGSIQVDKESGDMDALVVFTDEKGNIEHSYSIKTGDNTVVKEYLLRIEKLSEKRYVALGVFSENGIDVPLVTIIDEEAGIVSSKVYRRGESNLKWSEAWLTFSNIVSLSDGGFLAIGKGNFGLEDENGNYYEHTMSVVSRFDAEGRVIFSRYYNYPKTYWEYGSDTADWYLNDAAEGEEAYYLTGGSLSNARGFNIFAMKIDKNGNFVWSREYMRKGVDGNGNPFYFNDLGTSGLGIEKVGDKLLFFVDDLSYGSSINNLMLMQTNKDGEISFVKHYGTSSPYSYFRGMKKDGLGNIYIGAADWDVIKTDSNGNFIYKSKIGTGWFNSFTPNSDGSVSLTGNNGAFSTEPIVLKSNSNGTSCQQELNENISPTAVSDDFMVSENHSVISKAFEIVAGSENEVLESNLETVHYCLIDNECKVNIPVSRFDFSITDKSDDVGFGYATRRMELKYSGRVSGILISTYKRDENSGKDLPTSQSAAIFFGGEKQKNGCGDNTYPLYYPSSICYEMGLKVGFNAIPISNLEEPLYIDGHLDLWTTLTTEKGYYADGYFISILNENRDATVLKYDFESARTTLVKIPKGKDNNKNNEEVWY